MKHIKTIFILMAIFSLTHIAYSQQTLIAELPTTRNNETLTEIGSRVEVLSAFPVYIEKDLLFSEDTLFKIELSDDEFNVKKKYINHRDVNSFSFYGINGTNSLILSFLDDDIQGTFTTINKVYAIETHGEEYYMVQLDHSSMRENCDNIEQPSYIPALPENDDTQEGNADSASIDIQQSGNRTLGGSGEIKVLVLYTSAAANSVSNIYNTALLAEEESNISFANSEINCKIEIVYIGKTSYIESSSSTTDVNRFKETNDGYMDEVHTLRTKYAADICVLLENISGYCGEAYTIKADVDEAFCVVKARCATESHSFIHEIGHLMGCMHDYRCDPRLWPYAYGHGYVYPDGGWRTIMAYDDYCSGCIRLLYWSNPDVMYGGVSMGTSLINNNAKVWNYRYEEVGYFENVATNLTITSSTIPGSLNYGFVEAASNVETNGNVTLNSGQLFTIKAGNEIVFSDGFEASAGSELNAYIFQQSATIYATAPAPPSINVAPVRRRIDATEIINTAVVYPNPTMDELNIRNNGKEQPSKIVIMDVMGRPIMKLDNPTDVIKISQVPAGAYFIDIEFANRSERYRIIKK